MLLVYIAQASAKTKTTKKQTTNLTTININK